MKFKIALALGGGGARGFAHIGVLKVLNKEAFPIDLIVGTSMGAILGGAYALNQDIDYLEDRVKGLIDSKEIKQLETFLGSSEPEEKKILIGRFLEFIKSIYLWNISRTKKWLIDSNSLMNLTRAVISQDKSFLDTKIPFACVAADLLSGERVILKEGKLLQAILASCSLPGIFPIVVIKKRCLVDGGIVSPVPAVEAKTLDADFIIGVNVEGMRLRDNFKSGVDIVLQADQIKAYHFSRMSLAQCDFLISPGISNLSWADFSKAEFCIQKGIEAAEKSLPALRRTLRKKKLRAFFIRF